METFRFGAILLPLKCLESSLEKKMGSGNVFFLTASIMAFTGKGEQCSLLQQGEVFL